MTGLSNILALHGHKGEPGYELLHSPVGAKSKAAAKIFHAVGQAGVTPRSVSAVQKGVTPLEATGLPRKRDPVGVAITGDVATPEQLWAVRQVSNRKIKAAPVPSEVDRIAYKERVARQSASRQGGDARGNAASRRRRTERLLEEFGDGTHAFCPYCGVTMTASEVTQDRIYPGKVGGSYRYENLLPVCFTCNASRPDVSVKPFKRLK